MDKRDHAKALAKAARGLLRQHSDKLPPDSGFKRALLDAVRAYEASRGHVITLRIECDDGVTCSQVSKRLMAVIANAPIVPEGWSMTRVDVIDAEYK